MMWLEKPIKGTVLFCNNKDETVMPDYAETGYLSQNLVLFPGKVIENITMIKNMPLQEVQETTKIVMLPNESCLNILVLYNQYCQKDSNKK